MKLQATKTTALNGMGTLLIVDTSDMRALFAVLSGGPLEDLTIIARARKNGIAVPLKTNLDEPSGDLIETGGTPRLCWFRLNVEAYDEITVQATGQVTVTCEASGS